jgi:hypothetical protein
MYKQSHQSEYSIVEWGAPRKNHPSSGLHQPWKILLDLIKKKKKLSIKVLKYDKNMVKISH